MRLSIQITILQPNGKPAILDQLNTHDLAQFHMFQMDMVLQDENAMAHFGIPFVKEGIEPTGPRNELSKPAAEFDAPPSPGNLFPTYYNASRWKGRVDAEGEVREQYVNTMTSTQLQVAIIRLNAAYLSMLDATTRRWIETSPYQPALPPTPTAV